MTQHWRNILWLVYPKCVAKPTHTNKYALPPDRGAIYSYSSLSKVTADRSLQNFLERVQIVSKNLSTYVDLTCYRKDSGKWINDWIFLYNLVENNNPPDTRETRTSGQEQWMEFKVSALIVI